MTLRDPVDGVEYVTGDLRTVDLAALFTQHQVGAVVHLAAIVEPRKGMTEQELKTSRWVAPNESSMPVSKPAWGNLTVTSSGAAYGYYARNDGRRAHRGSAGHRQPFEFAYPAQGRGRGVAQARAPAVSQLGQLVLRPGTILGAGTDNQITALFTGRFVMTFRESDGPFNFIRGPGRGRHRGQRCDTSSHRHLQRRWRRGDDDARHRQGGGQSAGRDPGRRCTCGAHRDPPARRRRYGPEQVDFLLHRPVLDNTRLHRDFQGFHEDHPRGVCDLPGRTPWLTGSRWSPARRVRSAAAWSTR